MVENALTLAGQRRAHGRELFLLRRSRGLDMTAARSVSDGRLSNEQYT
jgi:hypothetical protein